MEKQLELFEKRWESFVNVVRGALSDDAQKEPLTLSRANMVLTKESASWQNDYTSNGRWLVDLKEWDKTKAREVENVLLKEMTFSDEPMPTKSKVPKFIGAIGGGGVGYGIASVLELGTLGTTLSTILPAAACYVGGNMYAETQQKKMIARVLENYCLQLDKYKEAIIAILKA